MWKLYAIHILVSIVEFYWKQLSPPFTYWLCSRKNLRHVPAGLLLDTFADLWSDAVSQMTTGAVPRPTVTVQWGGKNGTHFFSMAGNAGYSDTGPIPSNVHFFTSMCAELDLILFCPTERIMFSFYSGASSWVQRKVCPHTGHSVWNLPCLICSITRRLFCICKLNTYFYSLFSKYSRQTRFYERCCSHQFKVENWTLKNVIFSLVNMLVPLVVHLRFLLGCLQNSVTEENVKASKG